MSGLATGQAMWPGGNIEKTRHLQPLWKMLCIYNEWEVSSYVSWLEKLEMNFVYFSPMSLLLCLNSALSIAFSLCAESDSRSVCVRTKSCLTMLILNDETSWCKVTFKAGQWWRQTRDISGPRGFLFTLRWRLGTWREPGPCLKDPSGLLLLDLLLFLAPSGAKGVVDNLCTSIPVV